MTLETALTPQFRLNEIDHGELADILSSFFGGSMQAGKSAILYPGDANGYALRLTYEGGTIKSIVSGPALTSDKLAELLGKLESDLIDGNENKVFSMILFADVPTESAFRYDDRFQILPPPENAPQPPFLLGWHPFVLEFRYVGNTNFSVDFRRRLLASNSIELFLVGVMPSVVGGLGIMADHEWVMIPNDKDGVTDLEYRYLQVGYQAGSEGIKSDFSDLTPFKPMEFVDQDIYYSRRRISVGESLALPSHVNDLLNRAYSLTTDRRAMFLRSCFWFRHSRRVHNLSRSAVFTALISAVESLIEDESGVPNCQRCNRPLGKGRNKLFQELVNRLAPDPSGAADRKKLYQLRSRLSHGGALLLSDLEAWSPNLHPDRIDEWSKSGQAWNIVKVVLVNWLLESSQTDTA